MAKVWQEVAKMEQHLFLELFGSTDWDVYRPCERKLLEDKVGMVIFGPPEGDKYDLWQVDHIQMVTNTIVRKGFSLAPTGTTWTAIVMVVVRPPDAEYYCHPVFRVPRFFHNAFVDCLGRFYQTWKEYLENNKLPENSDICYPPDGIYSRHLFGEARLEFARTKCRTLLKVADGASNVLAVGSVLGVAGAAALSVPVAAPVMLGAAVVSAVCGVYDSARAVGDQVDRARHGQRIGLLSGQSLSNWLTVGMGVVGVRSAYKIVRSAQVLTKGAKLGVVSRSLGSLRTLGGGIPREMYRDARCKAMPLRHLPRYALMLGHVVADAGYIADFLLSSGGAEGGITALRSGYGNVSVRGESLRYLDFLGLEGGKLQEVYTCGVSDLSRGVLSSPALDVEAFEGVSACLRKTLERGRHLFANFSIDRKAAVDYFLKYDLTFYLEFSGKVAIDYLCDKVGAVAGVLSMLYRCLRKVVEMARTEHPSLVKFTKGEILGLTRICMEKGVSFYDKFSRLCTEYVLPKLGEVAMAGAACLVRKCITSGNSAGSSSEGAVPEPGNSSSSPSKGNAPEPSNSSTSPSKGTAPEPSNSSAYPSKGTAPEPSNSSASPSKGTIPEPSNSLASPSKGTAPEPSNSSAYPSKGTIPEPSNSLASPSKGTDPEPSNSSAYPSKGNAPEPSNSSASPSKGTAPEPSNSSAYPSKGTALEPGNSPATPSEEAVLRAASKCVGVALGGSRAKVAFAGSEIFVIITDPGVGTKVVQVKRDEKGGDLVASLLD